MKKKQREISMRKIKELLRLHAEGCLSQRQIAMSLNLSVGVVNKYVQLSTAAGISWPISEDLSHKELLHMLHQHESSSNLPHKYADINCPYIHQELKRKHVTQQLLWEEYCEKNVGKQCYSYAQFTRIYKAWKKCQSPSMRQTHKAGDKLFIDYCGATVPIIDNATGEVKYAQIFVGVMGASNYTFAEATWTQSLPDWIGSHVRMFRFFNGVPCLLVPDNLRSAINKACRYEPDINRTYADLVSHYNTAVLPARPRKPKDKSKAENGVLVVERWILARLRDHQFFSLAELNQAIKNLLNDLNNRPFKKLPGTRRNQFETFDLPALKSLPQDDYEFAEFKITRVNMDYHVEVQNHYYSVPYQLLRQEVDIRLTANMIEIFHQNKRVAIHQRSDAIGKHSTNVAHMPKAHQKHAGWTPGYFLNWAIKIGPRTKDVVKHIIETKKHPEQSYRACIGLLRLEKRFSSVRLEKACEYALNIGAPRRKSVLSILDNKLDLQKDFMVESDAQPSANHRHENIRGADYYQTNQKEDCLLC